MNLTTKRILAILAGLLLWLGAYTLLVSARLHYSPTALLLPPTLAAGLLIGSGLVLLACVFQGRLVAVQQASDYIHRIDLQYFRFVNQAVRPSKAS